MEIAFGRDDSVKETKELADTVCCSVIFVLVTGCCNTIKCITNQRGAQSF